MPGFTLKVLLNGGSYAYPSSALGLEVRGTALSAAATPGWRVSRDGLTLSVYAGPIMQDYRLSPDDPSSRLRGAYAGGLLSSDVWYQPSTATVVEFNGSIASIGLIGSARAAFGWRPFDTFFLGPEAQALWCLDYQQFRAGMHVTAFRINAVELSAATGWAFESFGRDGPYFPVGLQYAVLSARSAGWCAECTDRWFSPFRRRPRRGPRNRGRQIGSSGAARRSPPCRDAH